MLAIPGSQASVVKLPSSQHPATTTSARLRLGTLRVLFLAILGGLLLLTIPWKNIEIKRVNIDLAKSKRDLADLKKAQLQLSGEIEALASYPRVAAWAEKELGWTRASTPPHKIVLSRQELSPEAQSRWNILQVRDE